MNLQNSYSLGDGDQVVVLLEQNSVEWARSISPCNTLWRLDYGSDCVVLIDPSLGDLIVSEERFKSLAPK